MFKNYFKVAWRNIIRNKFYSIINIVGLSTGIAFALLIGAYTWSQLQVNANLKNADRQFVIQSKWKNPNEGFEISSVGPLAKALKDNYPDLVVNYYRFDGITSNVLKNNKAFREDIAIGDSTILNMYGFKLLYGNAANALKQPFTVVITADKALKYFGKKDVVGQTITIENFSGSKHDFLITAVLNYIPNNSVTQLVGNYPNELFVADNNLNFFGRNMDWSNPHIGEYVELQKGIDPKQLDKPMAYLIKQNAPPQMAADMTPYLLSLKDYYLNGSNNVVKKTLYALSAIAVFILLMAIINFINMSVSRAAARMREIGIRKVLGGLKRQLMLQFLIESIIITFFATVIALIIYISTQKLFSNILRFEMPSLLQFPAYFIAFPLLLVLIIGFVAGIYPAFILSSLRSVESLKGKLSTKDNSLLRKSLIAFQFGTATVAFISAIIISQQVNLFFGKDIGFNKDYVVSAQLPRDWTPAGVKKMETIRDQFANMPQVKDVALSFEILDGNNSGSIPVYKNGADSTTAIAAQVLISDENYLNVYQVPLKRGNFFEGNGLDSGKVVINETAVKTLGYNNDNIIGRQLRIPGDPTIYTVRGVVKDFHFGSMRTAIAPVIFFNVDFATQYRFFSFRIKPGDVASTINALQKEWNTLMPGAPFEYKFMDETLANIYTSEIELKKASYTATVLALIIVLLGVVGLISLSVQKRTKEIGIRKVLGSSVAAIISLFIKEFLLVILIGGIFACPLAYIIMHGWLQGYAFRVDITATPFVISIICLGFVTALLICLQTMKAAIASPVKSLRTE
jgi:ABC-type antimicrobial peptide transport system permease subunit